ncbi:MAG: glutamyl-tRNA reductase [Clostridiaceae bacterium]|nr:glutamyl-tRNA reductase [Clostridiaceae bacterium]MDD5798104.1 glutamyl-tRNA reductase [Clostridiaceae bacterium]MDY4545380.1 glutamyl-tRNA reductase [Candidatus Choladocola sp.]
MDISLISISHKNAPLEVRTRFAFPVEAQEELMRQVIARNIAEECVFISTCNRTEIYTYHACPGSNFIKMQALLFEFAGIQVEEEMGDYVRMYQGSKAIKHLFHVAAGLDSMVMGEDQILGQVKRAHEQAHQIGTCGVYLNTLFRYAVTAAKKVKTETDLSRTTVSMATMAIKAAEQGLGTLHGKKVMLIGASGKIGSVVLKNLQCIEGAKVCITSRNMSQAKEDHHHRITYQVMEYDNRYELMDEMDVIISATASPHYTVTYGKLSKVLKTEKPRVLIDLAVPIDIEAKVEQIPGVKRFDVDDFQELARVNNEKKQHEVQAADQILAEIQKDFERWMVFQLSLPKIEQLKKRMLEEAEKKGFERAIDKMLYKLRDHSEPSELYAFFSHMEEND